MSDYSCNLPSSWVVAPIGDLLSPLEDGRTLHHGWSPQCEKQPSSSEDEWGVLKTTAVQDGEFLPEHNKRLPTSLTPRQHLEVREGDLLITCAGPRIRCGVPCLVRKTRRRLIISGKMYRFRVHDGLMDSRYIEAFLRSKHAQTEIDRMKTGISDSGLNLTHGRFLPLQVPVAPLNEQERIVAKIEELFSDLDAGVAALERAKANLKRYRAAVLKAAVEGKLTQKWRAENPPKEPASKLLARILKERRKKWEQEQLAAYKAKGKQPPKNWRDKYKEPAGPGANLPALPEGWCWACLSQLLAEPLRNGHSAKRSKDGTGVRTLTLTAITDGDFSEKNTKLTVANPDKVADLWLKPGDIFIERSNTPELVGTAQLYRGPCKFAIFPDLLIRVRTTPLVSGVFVETVLHSYPARVYFRRRAQGIAGSMPKIDQTTVENLPLPLPPADEQETISVAVEEIMSAIDSNETLIAAATKRSPRLRQSILKRAFEGRLVPQDPSDEPATVLIERIAKGRAEATTKKNKRQKKQNRKKSKAAGR